MSGNMTRLNVRCCCQPQKILGTLPYPKGRDAVISETVYFRYAMRTSPFEITETSLKLLVAIFKDPVTGVVERAYKAEGISIEKLRNLKDFVEAT